MTQITFKMTAEDAAAQRALMQAAAAQNKLQSETKATNAAFRQTKSAILEAAGAFGIGFSIGGAFQIAQQFLTTLEEKTKAMYANTKAMMESFASFSGGGPVKASDYQAIVDDLNSFVETPQGLDAVDNIMDELQNSRAEAVEMVKRAVRLGFMKGGTLDQNIAGLVSFETGGVHGDEAAARWIAATKDLPQRMQAAITEYTMKFSGGMAEGSKMLNFVAPFTQGARDIRKVMEDLRQITEIDVNDPRKSRLFKSAGAKAGEDSDVIMRKLYDYLGPNADEKTMRRYGYEGASANEFLRILRGTPAGLKHIPETTESFAEQERRYRESRREAQGSASDMAERAERLRIENKNKQLQPDDSAAEDTLRKRYWQKKYFQKGDYGVDESTGQLTGYGELLWILQKINPFTSDQMGEDTKEILREIADNTKQGAPPIKETQ